MNLTPRDKKLLIALGIVVFIVVFLKFLILPKFNNITTLKTDIDALKNTYAMNITYKAKTESLDSDIKILSTKLQNLRAIYPPNINVDELLIIMKELISGSTLEVRSMTFERAKPTNLLAKDDTTSKAQGENTTNTPVVDGNNQTIAQQQSVTVSSLLNYFYLWGLKSQQNANSTEAIVIPDGKGYSVLVKIDGKGTNEQIKSFLVSLGELDNRAYCKNISIVNEQNGRSDTSNNMLKFSAEIEFYGIMDKGAGEYYLLPYGKWMPIDAAGKSNVFEAYNGFDISNVSKDKTASSISKMQDENISSSDALGNYDFSVIASAFGGGLAPSVSVACKNPEASRTYSNPIVYGDSKSTENVEIFIEKKAGKYYCKFKTDHEQYPDKQYNETFEFIPVGKDLKLIILSSERSGDEDKAGVNITLINNTDKKLVYNIKFEDKKSPRVKIGKTVGNVNNE